MFRINEVKSPNNNCLLYYHIVASNSDLSLMSISLWLGVCCGLCNKKKSKKIDGGAKYMVSFVHSVVIRSNSSAT